MATVIAFPIREGKVRNKVEGHGPATILMFTGVRFERLDEEPAALRSTSRRLISNASQATAEELDH